MLEFQSVTKRDAARLHRYYRNCRYGLCEYSVGTKLMWRKALRPSWTEAAGCLVVRNDIHGRMEFDYPVPGPEGDEEAALEAIEGYCLEKGVPVVISMVPECRASRLLARYPYVQISNIRTWRDYLYYRDYRNTKQRVGVLYRRISDEYLDPLTFLPESLIGIPNLMEVYRKGHVAIVNAPGNGVADDKGIYYFVPKMIRYYLDQEPILKNAPTYLPYYPEDRKYVLDHLEKLVVKDVAEAGGYGVIFGNELSREKLSQMKEIIKKEPRRFIAQEVIDFQDMKVSEGDGTQDMKVSEGDGTVLRKADLRAFVLSGKETKVWASGLTRFSRNPDSFVVNSSQGGGFKDTWVLSQ